MLTEDGKPKSVAFRLTETDRADDDPHLSVNWLEYFQGKSRDEQATEIRTILAQKLNRVGGMAKLALAKVSEIHEKVRELELEARVLHWPDTTPDYSDGSHAGIFDVEADEDIIALSELGTQRREK